MDRGSDGSSPIRDIPSPTPERSSSPIYYDDPSSPIQHSNPSSPVISPSSPYQGSNQSSPVKEVPDSSPIGASSSDGDLEAFHAHRKDYEIQVPQASDTVTYWPSPEREVTDKSESNTLAKKRTYDEMIAVDPEFNDLDANDAECAAFQEDGNQEILVNPIILNEDAENIVSDVSSEAHTSSSSSEDDICSVISSAPSNASDSYSSPEVNGESDISDNAASESDESDSYHHVSPKIYPTCPLTQDEGILQVMELFLKHRLEKTVVGSILKTVLKFIPEINTMPKSQFTLFQYVEKLGPLSPEVVHFYCSDCHHYLGEIEENCSLCGASSKKFYQLSIKDQLKNLFENHGMADAIDKYALECATNCNSITDLADGSEFKRARINGKYSLTLLGHTDGISMSDSSDISMWPLEFVISELPPYLRFKYVIIAGIWIDDCKPTLNEYLKPFVKELENLGSNGFQWTHPKTSQIHTSQVSVPCFCVDAPVRASIQNIQSFNSKFGCNICQQKTKKLPREPVLPGVQRKPRKRVFTFNENDSKLRTMQLMDAQGRETASNRIGRTGQKFKALKGVKGDSVISSIPGCDRSTVVYPEYMHLVLCLIKDFVKLWFEKDGPWNLKNHQDKINAFFRRYPGARFSN